MIYLDIKTNVRLKRYTYALDFILGQLLAISDSYRGVDWIPAILTVTSINDSNHVKIPLSRHYTDEAVDVRTHNFKSDSDKKKFCEILEVYLNQHPEALRKDSFYINLEDAGTDNEHIHIQVKKGETYP